MAYINYLPIYSRGAMINLIEAPRDVGKTFTAKFWGTRRFLKNGKKFIWVRRTEEETKTAKAKFFKKKLLKMLGLKPDDVRVKGNFGYIKRGKKWVDFVEFCSLATAEKQRSVDDDDYTLMFVDEAFATPSKQAAYKGDEVRDFIDLYISKKRDHKLTAFILGNKEVIDNPYYRYFNITPPADGFNGCYMFQNGTICVYGSTAAADTPDKHAVMDLLRGTPYYGYMFEGAAKCENVAKYAIAPKSARIYCAFDLGHPITIVADHGDYYARKNVDKTRAVFVSRETSQKYHRHILLTKKEKTRFISLENAYKRGRLFFDDALTAETVFSIFEKIGIAK